MKNREPSSENLITVGKVLREWALKGELLVLPLTFDPKRFLALDRVAIEFNQQNAKKGFNTVPAEWKKIGSVKFHDDLLLISLEDCDSPEEAKKYRGALIKIDVSESPELPEGVYYHYQITGLKVYTVKGDYLGEIKEIMEAGPNDIYVVEGNKREYLIPAIKETVKQIDIGSGRMIVELMEEI